MSAMKIVCLGEPLIEIAKENQQVKVGFGGDTLNTAVYMARLSPANIQIYYASKLGDDHMTAPIHQLFADEGICTDLLQIQRSNTTGLYAIDVDEQGEKSFAYWRAHAPARSLFAEISLNDLLQIYQPYDALYLSGISLAVLFADSLEKVLSLMASFQQSGRKVFFDTNYRERLWAESTADVRDVYHQAMGRSTHILPSQEDLDAIFTEDMPAYQQRLMVYQSEEILVKTAGETILAYDGNQWQQHPITKNEQVVDSTAAGDSFNAAYIMGRLSGQSLSQAIQSGHNLAIRVIGAHGAIIPQSAMPQ